MSSVTSIHDGMPRIAHRNSDTVIFRGMALGDLEIANEAVEKTGPRLFHSLMGWSEVSLGFWRVVALGRRNTFDIVLKSQKVIPQSRLLPDDQIEATFCSLSTSASEVRFLQPISLSRVALPPNIAGFVDCFVGLGEVQCSGQNKLFPNDLVIDFRAGSSWGLRTPVLQLS